MLRGSFCIPVNLFHNGLKSWCGFDSCLEIEPELSGPVFPAHLASDRDVWTDGSTWLCRCQPGHPQPLTSLQQKLQLWETWLSIARCLPVEAASTRSLRRCSCLKRGPVFRGNQELCSLPQMGGFHLSQDWLALWAENKAHLQGPGNEKKMRKRYALPR